MASLHSRNADGSAYGRPLQQIDEKLARVGPGTPCGELFRRYWQPTAEADKVTIRPQNVRILGEDLVLFRDRKGRPGLLYPRCMHRGTSLFYGKVEDEGIRAATTAGCLASMVNVSISRASQITGDTEIRLANLGIQWKTATGWCSPIWARPQRSQFCLVTISSNTSIRMRR